MRLIDAEFEEAHYTSMLLNPTPDVTAGDKRKAQIIIDALKMAKTVDAEPVRHGKWIVKQSGHNFMCTQWHECDQCHTPGDAVDKYCRGCGARMDGDTE